MLRDAATTCDAPPHAQDLARRLGDLTILTAEDESRLAEAAATLDAASTSKIAALGGLIEAQARMAEFRERVRTLDARLEAARDYSEAVGANLALARALHDRLAAGRRDAAAGLRDARRLAHERLGLVAPSNRPVA